MLRAVPRVTGAWESFRDPETGIWGKLRRVPGVRTSDRDAIFGVEVSASAEGEYQYVFDVAGRTPSEAMTRAKRLLHERFSGECRSEN